MSPMWTCQDRLSQYLIKEEKSMTNKNKGNNKKKWVYCKINNYEKKGYYKMRISQKKAANNVTEEIIYENYLS